MTLRTCPVVGNERAASAVSESDREMRQDEPAPISLFILAVALKLVMPDLCALKQLALKTS